jgi:serine/threonine protein kinase
MLSKTMPFRAKEVDQLLKQVVRAKFTFRPEEKWKGVSKEAQDLISKLLTKDTSKRFTIQDVKQHPW